MSASRPLPRPSSESEQDLVDRRVTSAAVANVDFAVRVHRNYDDEPDAIVDEICRQTSACDLKLDFRDRAALSRFLQEYEAMAKACAL
jgi:hypothetical protein